MERCSNGCICVILVAPIMQYVSSLGKESDVLIQDLVDDLECQGEWVNRHRTRDHILYGSTDAEISKVGICWVATNAIIQMAAMDGVRFLITHENPFYLAGTGLPSGVLHAQTAKYALLDRFNMTIYRCHDLWDLYPSYGVRDSWVRSLGFGAADESEGFLSFVHDVNLAGEEVLARIVDAIAGYGEQGVEVIGDTNRMVHSLGIGTGACTDCFMMAEHGADACIVSDDGVRNWAEVQWAMDNNILLFVVNHMTSEMPGMYGMQEYLSERFPKLTSKVYPVEYALRHIVVQG